MEDTRMPMSRAAFDAIQDDLTNPTVGYYDQLIRDNPQIPQSLRGEKLTAGQNKLLRLLQFDWMVCDGGIPQFLMCLPFDIGVVGDTLEELGEKELYDLFTRAVAARHNEFTRAVAARPKKKGFWKALRNWLDSESVGEMSVSAELACRQFDDAYYKRSEQDASGDWVVVQVGLRNPFLQRLAAYVKAHPEEFITG